MCGDASPAAANAEASRRSGSTCQAPFPDMISPHAIARVVRSSFYGYSSPGQCVNALPTGSGSRRNFAMALHYGR
jgi:hypothetical protein